MSLIFQSAVVATKREIMYNRAFPVGNALFLFAGGVMSLLRLP